MSKLQNDFTTKQQSEKLVALGIPKLSANFYYDDENEVQIVRNPEFELQSKGYFPCWSVGRLIEIMNICSIHNIVSIYRTDRDVTQIDIIIETIINRINGNSIDFSKLEE